PAAGGRSALCHPQRAGVLKQACAGDGSLRREVEVLLAQDCGAANFLERPALEVAAAVANVSGQDPGQSWTGRKLGSYQVLSLLGRGGMGEVYCAEDTKLQRDVALKVLLQPFAQDPERLARFC